MSTAHALFPHASELFLGPARVVGMAGAAPLVKVAGAEVRAELALAFPYVPHTGDELLVVGQGNAFYVIGVLHGAGEIALRFVGDVRVHAVGGRLDLRGDEGVRIEGSEVAMVAGRITRMARRLVDRADSVLQRVRETLEIHAGERRELVDGEAATRADRATTVTRGVVSINGKEVHLN